ncbi:MAG TPA: hypothetical protein VF823_05675, partial [Anaerolineales bacterium]
EEEASPDMESGQDSFQAQEPPEERLDWLSSLRGPAGMEDKSLEDSGQAAAGSEEPTLDWSNVPSQSPGSEPDWLASMRLGGAPGEPDSTPLPDEVGEQAEEPPSDSGGWFAKDIQPNLPEPEDQEPEWLRRIHTRQSMEQSPEAGPEVEAASNDEPKPFASSEPEGSLQDDRLDWLTGYAEQNQPGDRMTGPAGPFAADEQAELPELEPLSGADLPDWLKEMKPAEEDSPSQPPFSEEAVPGESGQANESASGLAPANLPTWLEAMRPVESAAPFTSPSEEGEDQVENAGPLSGLRGVLPAEPDVTQVQKPPAYSAKLQVSEVNQANAATLEKMIQEEGVPRPLPRRAAITSQQYLRVGIAIFLALAVLWPLVTGGPQVRLPDFPVETGITNQLINQLPSGAPVLVAVDFEPGFSGEMNAASAGLVDHLILRGAYLTLVSTSPTGPAQAEQLLALVGRSSGFANPTQAHYENLGFIPGGAAGLQSFARAPRQMMPFTTDGSRAWESGPLQNLNSLGQFALVLVITESPDKARSWIEQVQPSLGSTPLVMVISAQAEPMVRPYYEARPQQVQGLVTGLAGGAAYENLNGRLGVAAPYWNAFSLGLLAAALLILIGGGVNALIALWSRQKKAARGEASR